MHTLMPWGTPFSSLRCLGACSPWHGGWAASWRTPEICGWEPCPQALPRLVPHGILHLQTTSHHTRHPIPLHPIPSFPPLGPHSSGQVLPSSSASMTPRASVIRTHCGVVLGPFPSPAQACSVPQSHPSLPEAPHSAPSPATAPHAHPPQGLCTSSTHCPKGPPLPSLPPWLPEKTLSYPQRCLHHYPLLSGNPPHSVLCPHLCKPFTARHHLYLTCLYI